MPNSQPPFSSVMRQRNTFICIAALAVLTALATPHAHAADLLIGMAETEITPPDGFPIAGYFHERLATGQVDPLKAKAIVFRGDGQQAALVVCDLTGISADLSTAVRTLVAERTGIPAANIAVSASHSHTAPDYYKTLHKYLTDRQTDDARSAYIPRLIDSIATAVEKASQSASPVTLSSGVAHQQTPVAFNRRFVMRDGSVKTWMNLRNPDVIRAAGPIDPEIGLLVVRDSEGKPLGVVSSFALHLDTVGGLRWSGDYPYFIEQSIRHSLGPDVISLFGTGCCGDINHSDPSAAERNKTDFIGNSLGQTIVGALPALTPITSTALQVRSQTVALPLQSASADDVAKSIATMKAVAAGDKIDFFDHVTAHKTLLIDIMRNTPPHATADDPTSLLFTHSRAGIGDHLPVDVQTICIGQELAIVCLPGEVFVDLGLAIKRNSPFRTTLIVELTNSVETCYIPTQAAYAGGSYEVTNSTVRPGAGELLVETSLRLLKEAASANTIKR